MFGQNDSDDNSVAAVVEPTTADVASVSDSSTAPVVSVTSDAPVTDAPADDAPVTDEVTDTPVVDAAADTPVVDETPTTEDTPVESAPEVAEEDAPASTDVSADDAELLDLKKQALEELSPLIDQLDQTPEEKFKTTMMMIQATDSANLVKVAHEAALKIEDEKVRAQALLDIVNEINYFTQK